MTDPSPSPPTFSRRFATKRDRFTHFEPAPVLAGIADWRMGHGSPQARPAEAAAGLTVA
ncbi:hypothetical protein GCM10010411_55730 [Actinomadura fulvescens]|uniref:Uncharacterized protein n=1 Tax=Actinomadura fulvescens TaxID=46160 RepID=A0ABP6CG11_9ACTN